MQDPLSIIVESLYVEFSSSWITSVKEETNKVLSFVSVVKNNFKDQLKRVFFQMGRNFYKREIWSLWWFPWWALRTMVLMMVSIISCDKHGPVGPDDGLHDDLWEGWSWWWSPWWAVRLTTWLTCGGLDLTRNLSAALRSGPRHVSSDSSVRMATLPTLPRALAVIAASIMGRN